MTLALWFLFGLPHHIASAYFCKLVFCFVLFFFVGEITEPETVQRPPIFPLEILERAQKNEKRNDLLTASAMGLG